MSEPQVILLEFNELSPSLMSRFIREGKLPNFKRFYDQSEVWLTEAAERAPDLDPWIQWVTVHTGANYAEHAIGHLNEGHTFPRKRIWDLASDAGLRVFVGGSMSVRYEEPINGWVIPDPWTTKVAPYPSDVLPYLTFVQQNVAEHTNERLRLTRGDYMKFVRFMARHGLSLSTVSAILTQLAGERFGRACWKKATLLDKLQFDLFSWYYKRYKPNLSTLFLNSTAHFQHMYWREMEPGAFTLQPTREEQSKFGEAVLYGYQEMDALVGRLFRLADSNSTIVLCTALSQQPCLNYEEQGGKLFYRPVEFTTLLTFAGVEGPWKASPVMAEQFFVYFTNEDDARRGARQLGALYVGDQPVLQVKQSNLELFCGCQIFSRVPLNATMTNKQTGQSVNFFHVFYQVEGMKSGMHHPDGLFWVRAQSREHKPHAEKMPLAAVAPTILELLGVSRPDTMRIFDDHSKSA